MSEIVICADCDFYVDSIHHKCKHSKTEVIDKVTGERCWNSCYTIRALGDICQYYKRKEKP